MPCLLALIVLSILGIFSASHRQLAKEAFDCVFRRVLLRPCSTGFDVKVKSAVLSRLLTKSPPLAKFVNRRFELISWIFTLSLVLSLVWTLRGIYNFYAWGDCNGRFATGGFCAFDPAGNNSKISGTGSDCKDVGIASRNLSLLGFDTTLFPTQNSNSKAELVMLGCYSCEYTRKTYPLIRSLAQTQTFNFTFAHFPVKPETEYLLPYDACIYQQNPQMYWQYLDLMFASPLNDIAHEEYVQSRLLSLGINLNALKQCLVDPATQSLVQKQQSHMLTTGIYGTPTIFINGTPVVGPKPPRVYQRLLRGTWF